MSWLWKRGGSGPDKAAGPDGEDKLWFRHLAATLKDHKRVSAPTLTELLAGTPADREVASAGNLKDCQQVSAPVPSAHKQAAIMNWGLAAAVTAGLGLVLLYSRPAWDGKTSASEKLPRVSVHAGQASRASPAASGALGRPFELQRASDKRTAQDVGERVTRAMPDARTNVATASTDRTPAAAAASSAPIEAVEARPRAPVRTSPVARAPAIARAPARARIAPAVIGVPVGAGSSPTIIRSPPQWIGGGPNDADNRDGRYQGTVAVQIAIDPGGRVSNCAPVRGSGNAGLDAMTCRLLKERARFTPALDAQGRPVVSQAYRTIVWGRRRGK